MDKYRKYNWANKNQFIIDLNDSNNISNFLSNHNLSATSGNFKTFKTWLAKHEIAPPSHYSRKFINLKPRVSVELKLENVFCENSIYNTKTLKRLIRKNNLLEYKCKGCSNLGFWNNKPLCLQLEHRNGNNFDNRIENLEYLCPNCHTQTETYGSKNLHTKLFNKRLNLLLGFTEININNLENAAKVLELKIDLAHRWFLDNTDKLNENEIKVKLIKSVKRVKNNNLELHSKLENSQRLTLLKTIQEEKKNFLFSMNRKNPSMKKIQDFFNLDYQKTLTWIEKNDRELFLIIKNKEDINIVNRFQRLSLITNKKEVAQLALNWKTSVNGAKKWIRENAPEKFNEIYDDKHLEKNKRKVIKQNKKDYIAGLELSNFNLEDFMKENSLLKSSAYAIIKQHNPLLFENIRPKTKCIVENCGGDTRTCGKSNNQQRYKCLKCSKSFCLSEENIVE